MRRLLVLTVLASTLVLPTSPAHAYPVPSLIGTITVGTAPWGVAFSPDGNTAYVGNSGSSTLSVITMSNLTTTTVSGGVLTGSAAAGIAVTPSGGKVLITPYNLPEILGANASDLVLSNSSFTGCANPLPITMRDDGTAAYVGCGSGQIQAVDTATLTTSSVRNESGQVADIAYVPQGTKAGDDIAYLFNVVTGSTGGYFRLSNGSGPSVALPGYGRALAVDSTGTLAYVGHDPATPGGDNFSVFDISTQPSPAIYSMNVGGDIRGIALSNDENRAYLTINDQDLVKVVNVVNRTVTHSIGVGDGPLRIAVSPTGNTALVTNNNSTSVSLLDITEPALTPVFDTPVTTSGGYTVNVTNYDSAFTWTPTVNTGTVIAGTATGSTLPLTITGLASGASATTTVDTTQSGYLNGTATVTGSASPAPVTPPAPAGSVTIELAANPLPTAPRNPAAVALDSAARISWDIPLVEGTSPIESYEVELQPGGATCTTSVTSCVVSGLVNGTSYTFAVRSRNASGWGPWSSATTSIAPNATPERSIVISGVLTKVRNKPGIAVSGITTELSAGTALRPWIRLRGSSKFRQGSARVIVNEGGTFSWQRVNGKKAAVFFQLEAGELRSNRVQIPSRAISTKRE